MGYNVMGGVVRPFVGHWDGTSWGCWDERTLDVGWQRRAGKRCGRVLQL